MCPPLGLHTISEHSSPYAVPWLPNITQKYGPQSPVGAPSTTPSPDSAHSLSRQKPPSLIANLFWFILALVAGLILLGTWKMYHLDKISVAFKMHTEVNWGLPARISEAMKALSRTNSVEPSPTGAQLAEAASRALTTVASSDSSAEKGLRSSADAPPPGGDGTQRQPATVDGNGCASIGRLKVGPGIIGE